MTSIRGVAETNAIVAGSPFAAAKEGSVPTQIFWMKTRGHWCEKDPAPDSETQAIQPVILLLPDNSRDPDLTQALRDAKKEHLPRKPRR